MGEGEGGTTPLSTWKRHGRTCRLPAAPEGRQIKAQRFSSGEQKKKWESRQGRHMKENAALLTHASQLLTLRGNVAPRRGIQMADLGLVNDGFVLIEDGKIAAAGGEDICDDPRCRDAEEIDCHRKVVLPGFVDSHTHPVFTAPRLIDFEKRIAGASYEEIAAAGGGILSSLHGVRRAPVPSHLPDLGDPLNLGIHTLSGFLEMADSGTTSIEAKTGYGLDLDSELRSLRAIQWAAEQWPGTVIPTFLGAHVVPPEFRDNPDGYVRIVCEQMIPVAARERLAEYVDVFCERGAFTPEQSVRILRAAVTNGLKTRIHIGQLTHTALELFAEFHPTSFDHLDHLTDADIAWLANTDTVATLLPAANYFLGLSTFPPARKLIDSGVAVALATDYNPGTSPT